MPGLIPSEELRKIKSGTTLKFRIMLFRERKRDQIL